MSELKYYKLSELYEMSSGISTKPEQAGHGAPFLSFSSVFAGHFLPKKLPDQMDTSEEEQKTYSVKEGDVFLTRTSETLDELGMSSVAYKDYPRATYSGFLKRLRPTQSDKTYHKFMAFYLRSKLFRKTMDNNAVMTLRCSLNGQIFSYLDVLLPGFEEQIKIGDLLFLIHKKIELDNRINVELEAMAKLLYDYWFVQFDFPISKELAAAMGKPQLEGKPYKSSGGKMVYNEVLKYEIPEVWEAGTAACLFEFNPKVKLLVKNAKHFEMARLRTSGFMTDAPLTKKVSGGPKFRKGDVVVARITPCLENGKTGLITWLDDDEIGFGSTEFIVMRGRKQPLSGFGICMARSKYFRKYAILNMTGTSGRKRIEAEILQTVSLPIPNEELLKNFESIISPMLNQMTNNEVQNKELTSLRDWLLPMLMNGQVTVNE
jgi:type I restriction enzyme, S subunit